MNNNLPISIFLKHSNERFIHCVICGHNLEFKLEGYPSLVFFGLDATKLIENVKPLKFPIKAKCLTTSDRWGKCKALYIVQGFIEE